MLRLARPRDLLLHLVDHVAKRHQAGVLPARARRGGAGRHHPRTAPRAGATRGVPAPGAAGPRHPFQARIGRLRERAERRPGAGRPRRLGRRAGVAGGGPRGAQRGHEAGVRRRRGPPAARREQGESSRRGRATPATKRRWRRSRRSPATRAPRFSAWTTARDRTCRRWRKATPIPTSSVFPTRRAAPASTPRGPCARRWTLPAARRTAWERP